MASIALTSRGRGRIAINNKAQAKRIIIKGDKITVFYRLDGDYKTSAGIYRKDADGDEILICILWNRQNRKAGKNQAIWDRKDAQGVRVDDLTGCFFSVMYHNVTMTPDGVYANTSRERVSEHRHGSIDPTTCIKFVPERNALFIRAGYQEGDYTDQGIMLADTGQKFVVGDRRGGGGGACGNMGQQGNKMYYFCGSPYDYFLSFIYARDVNTGEKIVFPGGQPLMIDTGGLQDSILDPFRSAGYSYYTGSAVQRAGTLIFSMRGNVDRLTVIEPASATPIKQVITGLPNPCAGYCQGNNYLWLVTGPMTAKKLQRYPINSDRTLGTPELLLLGLSNPIDIIELEGPNAGILAVADGGTAHDIKFYNINTGERLFIGQFLAGGNLTSVVESNYRLLFERKSDGGWVPEQQASIAPFPDGGYAVAIPGKLIVAFFNAQHQFVKEVAYIPRCYSSWRDINDPSVIIANNIQFEIDPAKRTEDGWKRKRILNATSFIKPSYYTANIVNVTTLKDANDVVQGTYGQIRGALDADNFKYDTVQVRDEGVRIWPADTQDLGWLLRSDGCLTTNQQEGNRITYYRRDPTGFVPDGIYSRPTWGPPRATATAELPAGVRHSSVQGPLMEEVTQDGQTIVFNANLTTGEPAGTPHLALIKNNKVLKLFAPSTGEAYRGLYPTDGKFLTAGYAEENGGLRGYAASRCQAFDEFMISHYHGEFNERRQPAFHTIWHQRGLMVEMHGHSQVETSVGPWPEGTSGNNHTAVMAKTVRGWEYSHSSEGNFFAIYRTIVTGLEDVKFIDIPLV